jgi:putative DNA primase/helicase
MQKLNLISAADITPRQVEWLWKDWLADGKLHLLAGPPGVGKTNIAMSIAAILSIGGVWPCGNLVRETKTVIWSGEDSPDDTLVPRLIALGAKMENILFVSEVQNRSSIRTFDPANDLELLSQAIHDFGNVGLLILDPIASCVNGDSHKNAEVRRALQPLVNLGMKTKCGILGLTHLNKSAGKDPLEKVIGSIAFAALARIVLFATKIEGNHPSQRVLTRIKSNIGVDESGFYYELPKVTLSGGIETIKLEWGDQYDGNLRADLEKSNDSDDSILTELDDACNFLKQILAEGPVLAVEVQNQGREIGFSKSTMRRAKSILKIRSVRTGGIASDGAWKWDLHRQ